MIKKLFSFKSAGNADTPGLQSSPKAPEAAATGRHMGREEGLPWVWVCGGALVTILIMILALFGIILSQGLAALWPSPLVSIPMPDGTTAVGLPMRVEETTSTAAGKAEVTQKTLLYAANRDFSQAEFAYVAQEQLKQATQPPELWFVERYEWGPFMGSFQNVAQKASSAAPAAGAPPAAPESATVLPNPGVEEVSARIREAKARLRVMDKLERKRITPLNHDIEQLRLKKRGLIRRAQMGDTSSNPQDHAAALAQIDTQLEQLNSQVQLAATDLALLREQDALFTASLISPTGTVKEVRISQIVRAFKPNSLSFFEKIGLYLSRVWEFVSEEPREANTAGGVFPALFGTVAMTLLMTLAVLPVGVLTAVYMREIAKQGFLVSFVRIAVGNLAGVPSIVYGVFGLGFFCYTIGSSLDQLFFADKLPNPTFGTGGILWASLTLALLTVPVVIVSTEEALSSVPRTLREASYGCGATRLQTLIHVVLPKAMPGIMTGLILAMARGVGEVAPLLMTGVVKLAPALPIDAEFPFVHLERSFMHLGFHIYDLGFQSRSTEISRPMVFATTTLLVGIVLALNFVAIKIRSRLRMRFEGRGAF